MSFKIGDRVRVKKNFGGVNLEGMTGTIVETGVSYDWGVEFDEPISGGHDCGGACKSGYGRFGNSSELELAPFKKNIEKKEKEKEAKFKVGDKVIGNKKASKEYIITGEGYIGEVEEIRSDGRIRVNGFVVDPDCFNLYEDKEKGWRIEIVPNGEETTATLYKRGKAVKSATVKRYKGDEYSIADAADYAVQKLFEKNKKKEFKIGARVVGVGNFENRNIDGYKGTIREDVGGNRWGVEFDKDIGGHDLGLVGYRCKKGYGWYCTEKYLKLI